MDKCFNEIKKELEDKIPDSDSKDFKEMRNKIKSQLKKKENDLKILIRSLKIIIFGDWNTIDKKKKLEDIKSNFIKHGIYAQTIDAYYDITTKGRLSPLQILETCCRNHQLIVFIDGEGPGTITEQNYLIENYIFQKKTIFFIKDDKFNELKDDPSAYIRDFPTILTYTDSNILDKVLIYSKLRIHRLAGIIMKQTISNRGIKSPEYKPWKERLKKLKK
ncbi:MAG: hypothetical protein KAS90_02290 [Candidatus Aenigmarchaeota archaeon]|nr:hypothetical protein [Candidatus Aenigmarchaeota archaeon]